VARKRKNRYKERIEKGNYTKIPNEILEAASQQYLKPLESKILFFLLRKIWGWEKDREIINLSVFYKNLQFEKTNIRRALLGLQKKGIIIQLDRKMYEIQMNIDKWKVILKRKIKKIKRKTIQLDSCAIQLDRKTSLNHSINKQHRTPKETILKETKHHQRKDDEFLLLLKPKTLRTLTGKTFGLGNKTVIRLLAMTERKNVNSYFSEWIEYILSDPEVNTPGSYFIKVIEEGSEPKPTLEFTKRVKLFNSFTGKKVRAENSVIFENMVEKEVLEKVAKEIKIINHYYSRENEEELRQKKKATLIHNLCSLIKPSRLKRFKKKLFKIDPSNKNFRQVIDNGYELHNKKPYSDYEEGEIV